MTRFSPAFRRNSVASPSSNAGSRNHWRRHRRRCARLQGPESAPAIRDTWAPPSGCRRRSRLITVAGTAINSAGFPTMPAPRPDRPRTAGCPTAIHAPGTAALRIRAPHRLALPIVDQDFSRPRPNPATRRIRLADDGLVRAGVAPRRFQTTPYVSAYYPQATQIKCVTTSGGHSDWGISAPFRRPAQGARIGLMRPRSWASVRRLVLVCRERLSTDPTKHSPSLPSP